jgi:hypothetical protein
VIRSSIWLANTTVSFGVAAHAAGIAEVNVSAVAEAITARLFNMPNPPPCFFVYTRQHLEPTFPPVASPSGRLKGSVIVV